MTARVFFTLVTLALAIGGFLGAGPAPAGPFNAPGIILLIGAFIVWFGWPAGYSYRRGTHPRDSSRPDLMTVAAAPVLKNNTTEPGNGPRARPAGQREPS